MFDATTLSAVVDELNEQILRGRVQEIVQLDALAFGFEIYAQHQRRYLFVTAHPDDARVHLVSQKLRGTGEAPSPLLLLLRKHTANAFINSITQLPHERVLQIEFDHSSEGVSTLVVETMGKYSNLILLDAAGVVIDAVKRVTPAMNRVRVTLPHRKYAPPPPQNKRTTFTAHDLAQILAEHAGEPVWRVLVKSIAGVSPLLAREVECRAGTNKPERIWQILMELTRAPWQPCVAYHDDEPAAFAPYLITHLPHHQNFSSISAAIETFYGTPESYAAVKEPLRFQLVEARDKLVRKRDALAQEQARAGDLERLRVSGEMILAHVSQIQPRQEKLNAETEIGKLEIALDPKLSAVENAQRYFKEYHRAKEAAARVPALLAQANADVEYAEQMLNDLELAENRAEIDAVIVAARDAGLLTEAKQKIKVKPSEPRTFTSQDGFTLLVGKNARQNEELTFRRARADDLWLHARGVAGAHVVIVRAGREIPEATIQEAATLAAQYSQARSNSVVDVIVTPRKNVHRVRGGRAGMVWVTNERTISVRLSHSDREA
jgi:predicted ribosome quality control (RQC) complex YloA/Tae2 family protein